MHSFRVLSFLSLSFFFFLCLFDVVLWFFVLLAGFFELAVKPAVIWWALPSLPSDLPVVSSEDLNTLDSDQWRNKIIIKNEMIIIIILYQEWVVLVILLKRAHVERQLQVNHPPALHVLTKQKLSLSPSQGLPSSYSSPPPIPTRTQKKKVPLELVFFFSLITHCTEITFPLLTISEPIF